jgi:hypothetical protein
LALRVFYPHSGKLPSPDQIGAGGITLANKLVIDAARIQSVANVVRNFGPGSAVRPGAVTIFRRIGTREFKDLFSPLSFEEKLGTFGGAARNGAAINPDNRLMFEELFGG